MGEFGHVCFFSLLPFTHFGTAKGPVPDGSILLLLPSLHSYEGMDFYPYKLASLRYAGTAHKH